MLLIVGKIAVEDIEKGEYKDRSFCFLFGNEKYKRYALSLYNALNEVNYENELEIVTIRGFLYIRMHNDVVVMLSGNLELS